MHAKVPLSLGVELPLELLVLGIVGSAVRDDENRLQGTEREGGAGGGGAETGSETTNGGFVDSHRQHDTEPSKVRQSVTKPWNNAAPCLLRG